MMVLAACGLEPRYALPPPERDDGALRWVDAAAAPPPGSHPVVFDDPAGGQHMVCRSQIADAQGANAGYHTGELTTEGAGDHACLVAHRGGVIVFREADNPYQQLWVRDDAVYRWAALAKFPERPLSLSAIWQNSRLPGEYIRDNVTGAPVAYWMPCAAQDHGRWHLGKLALHDSEDPPCYLAISGREVGVRVDVRVLYAPVK
jgi:hypothetical protein